MLNSNADFFAQIPSDRMVRKQEIFSDETFRKQLVTTIVASSLPFRIVKNKEFQRLLSLLRPDVRIPGRTTIRADLDRQFEAVCKQLLTDLPTDQRVSIALDAWQSPFKKSFLAITAYHITRDWKYREALLGFEPLDKSHTGSAMATIVERVCDQFKIKDRLFCITTDNASNNDTMRRELEDLLAGYNLEWSPDATKIPCMAHVIQLVVKAILSGFKVSRGELEDIDADDTEIERRLTEAGTDSVASIIEKASHTPKQSFT